MFRFLGKDLVNDRITKYTSLYTCMYVFVLFQQIVKFVIVLYNIHLEYWSHDSHAIITKKLSSH